MILKKWTFSKTLWLLFYVFIFVLLMQHSFSYLDPDFGWHLRVGQDIMLSGQAPELNLNNYTLWGHSWVDIEWLANLTIYYFYINFGYLFINIFFAILPILTLVLLNRYLRINYQVDLERHVWALVFLETLGMIAVMPHLGVRIQEITLLFFAILISLLADYSQRKKLLPLIALVPLFCLWANLHGGFLLGLAILVMFLVVKSIERIIFHYFPRFTPYLNLKQLLSWRQILIFGGFSGLAFLSTLINPYFTRLYSFLSTYKNTFYLSHIAEWLPQWAFPYQYWQFTYISLGFIVLFFYFQAVFKNKEKRFNLWDLSLFLVLMVLAIKSRRHFPLFFVVSFPWIFRFFYLELFAIREHYIKGKRVIKNKYWNYGIKTFIVLVLLLASTNLLLITRWSTNPFLDFCQDKHQTDKIVPLYPCAAVDFLKNREDLKDGNLLNNFNWGGYLLWQYPERLLFIDGRMPQAEYKGRTILEEYYDFANSDLITDKLAEHKINLALLAAPSAPIELSFFEKNFLLINEKEINRPIPLLDFLASSSDWEMIYSDEISIIYKRK